MVVLGTLYIRVRWRRSPQAYRAMIWLTACYFVAGSIVGAWLLRLCVANFNFRRQSGSQTSHGSAAARNMTRLLRSDEEVHRCVEQA